MSSFGKFAERAASERGPDFADKVRDAEREFALSWQLRERRLELGLTQSALAQQAGVPQSEISRIESGAANPTLATVQSISEALGVRFALLES